MGWVPADEEGLRHTLSQSFYDSLRRHQLHTGTGCPIDRGAWILDAPARVLRLRRRPTCATRSPPRHRCDSCPAIGAVSKRTHPFHQSGRHHFRHVLMNRNKRGRENRWLRSMTVAVGRNCPTVHNHYPPPRFHSGLEKEKPRWSWPLSTTLALALSRH